MNNIVISSFSESVFRECSNIELAVHRRLALASITDEELRKRVHELDILLSKLSRFVLLMARESVETHSSDLQGATLAKTILSRLECEDFITYFNTVCPDILKKEEVMRKWNDLPAVIKENLFLKTVTGSFNACILAIALPSAADIHTSLT